MIAAMRNIPNATFTKIKLGFLVLCFDWLEFYKCFSFVLLLAVPLIIFINLVEPIIRVSKYCLERHPPTVFPQRGREVEWFFYSTRTRTRTLCLETRAYAVIDRVYSCPKETTLYNSLTYYLQHEEDEEDRRNLCSFATATDTI